MLMINEPGSRVSTGCCFIHRIRIGGIGPAFTVGRIADVDPFNVIRMIAAKQHGVITAEQCQAVGVSPDEVKTLCRDKRWLRLNRAIYLVDADLVRGDPPRLSVIRAAMFSAGPNAVAVLATAAELHGIAGPGRDCVVHLSLPGASARPRRPTESGIQLHQLVLRFGDTVSIAGMTATNPARTVADLMLRVDRFTAVATLDSGLNRRLLEGDDLTRISAYLIRRRGARRARPWLADVDGRAESPLETRVRLRAGDGGVPPDELQYRVRDRNGHVVAIADMAWTWAGVVGEADGVEAHDNPAAVFRDRKRQNDIINAGFVPVRFTWEDTLSREYIPMMVRGAIARSVET
jgi:hypothetical protein